MSGREGNDADRRSVAAPITGDHPFHNGQPVAISIATGVGAALVAATGSVVLDDASMATAVAAIEFEVGPRWVWWSKDTAAQLVDMGIRPARCADLDATHRLLHGGWRGGPGRVWAAVHGLDTADLPIHAAPDLFSIADDIDADEPIRPDGHLHPEWIHSRWSRDPDSLRRWTALALDAHGLQSAQVAALVERPAAPATARSESAAEMLCVELAHDGIPLDVERAEQIIATFIGPRPNGADDERHVVAARDELVLVHLDPALRDGVDLRNPASVKSLLRRAGVEVDDTRAWRLERLRDQHPIVDALLTWRKAERIATTFGYRWLDEHVGADHRLRGTWSGSDGAAGRMTATAGLHNLPADLRPAIAAEPGHRFVRADLGQIEPRILAAVSGDPALATATLDADMYAPVAARLGVPREIAKVAVLGAMYGQTTGHGAAALRGLEGAYPVAMHFLETAAAAAAGGNDLRTRGGRCVRMGAGDDDAPDDERRSRAAARGRYGRNAMVQGAAAEFFKTWAVIVRARIASHDTRIVMCLHDELLVHCPVAEATEVAALVDEAVQEAAHRWLSAGHSADVRFIADTSIIARWSEAK